METNIVRKFMYVLRFCSKDMWFMSKDGSKNLLICIYIIWGVYSYLDS